MEGWDEDNCTRIEELENVALGVLDQRSDGNTGSCDTDCASGNEPQCNGGATSL